MDETDIFLYFCAWALVGLLIGTVLGHARNRVAEGALWGFVLGPLGWIIFLLLPAEVAPFYACPECGGETVPGARRCKHCGQPVERVQSKPYSPPPPMPQEEPVFQCPHCKVALLAKDYSLNSRTNGMKTGLGHAGYKPCSHCGFMLVADYTSEGGDIKIKIRAWEPQGPTLSEKMGLTKQEITSPCPCCGVGIKRSLLRAGSNECPYCDKGFDVNYQ